LPPPTDRRFASKMLLAHHLPMSIAREQQVQNMNSNEWSLGDRPPFDVFSDPPNVEPENVVKCCCEPSRRISKMLANVNISTGNPRVSRCFLSAHLAPISSAPYRDLREIRQIRRFFYNIDHVMRMTVNGSSPLNPVR
jgi:hypothetical protein